MLEQSQLIIEMVSLKKRGLQLKVAAVTSVAVLAVLVVVLFVFGAVLSEGLLAFAEVLGIAGITSPTIIAAVFSLLVLAALSAVSYTAYRRFVHL